jgi:hypothetical protein
VRNLHQPTWKTGKIGSPSGISSDLASLFCRFWQNFLDEEAREFTTVEACRPLLEPCFQPAMVVLLMLQGNCSCLRAKAAHFPGHLPIN